MRAIYRYALVLVMLGWGAKRGAAQPTRDAPTERPAQGEPSDARPSEDVEKPWAVGVSPEDRAKAESLLEQGNQLFLAAKYREALEKYRAAIDDYDHPVIRFNIARALINLDRPTEAYENIQAALKYGEPGLKNLYEEARNYERLLKSQIAELEIECSQPEVAVTVDGVPFLECPGEQSTRLMPGNHQVVAKRKGYMTLTREIVVMPGAVEPFEVTLVSYADATITERRWPSWKPWAVVGGGASLVGLGLLLDLDALASRDDYETVLRNQCAPDPCPSDALPSWSPTRIKNVAGVSAMVTGGAMVVGGIALVILNRPRAVLPDDVPEPSSTVVVPSVSPEGFGAMLVHRF